MNFNTLIEQYHGSGPYLFINNTPYIDAASGTFNLPLGYTHTRLAEKLKQQIDRCVHLSSAYTKELSNHLLKKLTPHLPDHINALWLRDVSGSGAIEGAIRIAQKATGKAGVISLFMSHHGQSMITAHISGNAFRLENFSASIEGSLKLPVPDSVLVGAEHRDLIDYEQALENHIQFGSNGRIGCFIIEPILGNGGNIVLPTAYYRAVRNVCNKHGILIIADEVQTGFGRTGDFFASTGYAKALEPDMIVFAKGAGGIGIPTGGILMRKELDLLESFEHSSTSGANPLSLVALNEIIDIIEEDQLLNHVKAHESILSNGLLNLQKKYPFISHVRGMGYMFGFDMPTPEIAKQVIDHAHDHGLIIRGSRYGKGSAIKIRPPLICNELQLREILHKLSLALHAYSANLKLDEVTLESA